MRRRAALLTMMSGTAPVVYLLRDDFTDTRGAGEVNNTAATPGPGTRKTVETDGSIVIGSGVMSYNNLATPAWGELGSYYDEAVSRASGQIVSIDTTIPASGHHLVVGAGNGLGVSYANVVDGLAIQINGTQTNIIISTGSSRLPVFAIVGSEIYTFYFVLRSTGFFWFMRSSVSFPAPYLIGVYDVGATASAKITIGLNTAPAGLTNDKILVPEVTWLPVPKASDSFDRANGAIGATDGLGHIEQNGGGSLAWSNQVGTVQIASNKAQASALTGGVAIATVPAVQDFIAIANLVRGTAGGVFVLRYVNADNYAYVIHDGTNLKLIKRVAGVETTVITGAATYASGARVYVRVDGNNFGIAYNDARIGNVTAITDPVLQSSALQGLYFADTDSTLDNFQVWRVGYNDDYVQLITRTQDNALTQDTAQVLLTFDDGDTTLYSTVFPYMQSAGIVGTAYIVTNLVGDGSHVTWAQLQEMNTAGWSIGNHTSNHSTADATNLAAGQTALNANSLSANSDQVAYPAGTYNETVRAAMISTGMKTGRLATGAGFSPGTIDQYQINSISAGGATTLASVITSILAARVKRQTVTIYMHDISASPSGSGWTTANFQGLVDFLVAREIPCVSINALWLEIKSRQGL